MVGPGRAGLAAAMGSPPVVMGLILGRDRPQMPFAEDEHPVGDLRPGGEHESFRVSVRVAAREGSGPCFGTDRPTERASAGRRHLLRTSMLLVIFGYPVLTLTDVVQEERLVLRRRGPFRGKGRHGPSQSAIDVSQIVIRPEDRGGEGVCA